MSRDDQHPIPPSDGDAAAPRAPSDWLRRIRERGAGVTRYEVRDEIGRGGMGVVRRVWDDELRRTLAMKILAVGEGEHTPPPDSKLLGRFFEEAQITGQLDHPGVVPVHELGADANGRPFFTMRLVKGRDLHEMFALAKSAASGWTRTRAIDVLLKVCDTMAFAHQKGVLHRDLKPANIRVGDFGEVYVMDWGLARVMGRPEARDIRLHDVGAAPRTLVQSDRRRAAEGLVSDPELYTLDGDVVGTPAYMSPEQARGEIERLDVRSDVYSIGAMLYHLLTGRPPYATAEGPMRQDLVLIALLEGPPKALQTLAPDAPPELAAICEKAMAREPDRRYASTKELADDLRAYVETRVVRAYATGPIAELGKWMRRNRALAAALVAVVLALAIGLGFALSEKARADANAEAANAAAHRAQRERSNVLRLSAFQELDDLRADAARLWPADPELAKELDAWLARAHALVAGLDPDPKSDDEGHRARLAELRARGTKNAAGEWTFADEEDRWWHAQLTRLIEAIEAFADPKTGWIDGLAPEFAWGVARRAAFARELRERSLDGAAVAARWKEALASIADRAASPRYGGFTLAPQLGLVPLGRDPESGLWEFTDLASGEIPTRAPNGRLVVDGKAALTFVLIPRGSFSMGAQAQDPAAANYDPAARAGDGPVREVAIEPFFLAKYEMTQGQWSRLVGANPSYFAVGYRDPSGVVDERHPVEQVAWLETWNTLRRFGFELPSSAQWEYAARAGTSTAWSTGSDLHALEGSANLCDADAVAAGVPWRPAEEWLHDGHVVHAPVGSFRPNAFGLFDVHGNVFEWCRDALAADSAAIDAAGEKDPRFATISRVMRGGSFGDPAVFARSGLRAELAGDSKNYILGVRPMRRVR
ncbi:MAG: SUMF1/EgtB/PvdO family nonheme iron enzyme [Planctomycetes bacterium]|nr:SUMF1/EgtB/PvdO family nonheme iron enzyme [Planctomycetota bacterium]